MGAQLRIVRVAIGAVVRVPEEVVEHNVGYVPAVLGANLAEQVQAYVRRGGVGYFPALDYFRARPEAVDPALLGLTDEVASFCVNFTSREFRRRLSRAFSNVQVQQAQATAYTLPKVRRQERNASAALSRHYSPNGVKVELVLSSIEKQPVERVEKLAARKVAGWTRAAFDDFELLPARRLGDDG
jgi:hypothetical protein